MANTGGKLTFYFPYSMLFFYYFFVLFSFVPAAVGCINCAKFPTRSISHRLENRTANNQQQQQQRRLRCGRHCGWEKPAGAAVPVAPCCGFCCYYCLRSSFSFCVTLTCSAPRAFLFPAGLLSASSSSFFPKIYVCSRALFLFSPLGIGLWSVQLMKRELMSQLGSWACEVQCEGASLATTSRVIGWPRKCRQKPEILASVLLSFILRQIQNIENIKCYLI